MEFNEKDPVEKAKFSKEFNYGERFEEFLICRKCQRRLHKICLLHYSPLDGDFNCCKHCRSNTEISLKIDSDMLPNTECTKFMEIKISELIAKWQIQLEYRIRVRVLSEHQKPLDLGELKAFLTTDQTYINRTIFASLSPRNQRNRETIFFGMHVHLSAINKSAYLSYMDSIQLLENSKERRAVYHAILLSLFDYLKSIGYQKIFVWSCPPKSRDDYVFHLKPSNQKNLTPELLNEWYKNLFRKGYKEEIIDHFDTIMKHVEKFDNVKFFDTIPLFEGDLWLTKAEQIYKNCMKEADKRAIEILVNNYFPQANNHRKGKKENLKVDYDFHAEFFYKFLSSLETFGHSYYVVQLKGEEPLINDHQEFICEMVDDRYAFLNYHAHNSLQYSDQRKAEYSTKALLYRVLVDRAICGKCGQKSEGMLLCSTCFEESQWIEVETPKIKKKKSAKLFTTNVNPENVKRTFFGMSRLPINSSSAYQYSMEKSQAIRRSMQVELIGSDDWTPVNKSKSANHADKGQKSSGEYDGVKLHRPYLKTLEKVNFKKEKRLETLKKSATKKILEHSAISVDRSKKPSKLQNRLRKSRKLLVIFMKQLITTKKKNIAVNKAALQYVLRNLRVPLNWKAMQKISIRNAKSASKTIHSLKTYICKNKVRSVSESSAVKKDDGATVESNFELVNDVIKRDQTISMVDHKSDEEQLIDLRFVDCDLFVSNAPQNTKIGPAADCLDDSEKIKLPQKHGKNSLETSSDNVHAKQVSVSNSKQRTTSPETQNINSNKNEEVEEMKSKTRETQILDLAALKTSRISPKRSDSVQSSQQDVDGGCVLGKGFELDPLKTPFEILPILKFQESFTTDDEALSKQQASYCQEQRKISVDSNCSNSSNFSTALSSCSEEYFSADSGIAPLKVPPTPDFELNFTDTPQPLSDTKKFKESCKFSSENPNKKKSGNLRAFLKNQNELLPVNRKRKFSETASYSSASDSELDSGKSTKKRTAIKKSAKDRSKKCYSSQNKVSKFSKSDIDKYSESFEKEEVKGKKRKKRSSDSRKKSKTVFDYSEDTSLDGFDSGNDDSNRDPDYSHHEKDRKSRSTSKRVASKKKEEGKLCNSGSDNEKKKKSKMSLVATNSGLNGLASMVSKYGSR